ncbi:uncharacterized protein PGTG_19666 [Puccinia graminis f. sp. tritici CRL 75-36-700-3]|uniref:Uncharacterized protein n=1 Tax=Puccinia graminis f. sp. tritici (strain CRL 75-36-700-3 / race SCCL) TaxID=418459 RepID=E3LAX2_PUCGT|nr:uncharacterized protein PGTG_19666 [Puccinia graminis f. sp. tritici CRL 75-36-700-3]EFP93697.2 hypothetical protein PGTG_19666 [Puccinia graminis f. sp. tritici CRL 75-36-700-3]
MPYSESLGIGRRSARAQSEILDWSESYELRLKNFRGTCFAIWLMMMMTQSNLLTTHISVSSLPVWNQHRCLRPVSCLPSGSARLMAYHQAHFRLAFVVGPVGDPQSSATALDDSVISQSKLDGADVVLAYLAEDPSFQQPPEALFRSLSLVAIDNTISEWSFANHFFGQLSSGTQQVPGSESTLFPNTSRLDLGPASVSDSSTPMIRKGSFLPIPQTQVTTLALFPDIHKQLVNYE